MVFCNILKKVISVLYRLCIVDFWLSPVLRNISRNLFDKKMFILFDLVCNSRIFHVYILSSRTHFCPVYGWMTLRLLIFYIQVSEIKTVLMFGMSNILLSINNVKKKKRLNGTWLESVSWFSRMNFLIPHYWKLFLCKVTEKLFLIGFLNSLHFENVL